MPAAALRVMGAVEIALTTTKLRYAATVSSVRELTALVPHAAALRSTTIPFSPAATSIRVAI